MKKSIIILLILLVNVMPLNALNKLRVTLSSCVDGDTAKFMVNGKIQSTRFLAIDTPESTIQHEAFGEEASNYTCDRLTNAKIIELEYDSNSDRYDKYDRLLAWIWVDGSLLQKDIISVGYAEVAYLYGDYKYTSELQDTMEIAKQKQVGMWANYENNSYDIYIWLLIIVILIIVKQMKRK